MDAAEPKMSSSDVLLLTRFFLFLGMRFKCGGSASPPSSSEAGSPPLEPPLPGAEPPGDGAMALVLMALEANVGGGGEGGTESFGTPAKRRLATDMPDLGIDDEAAAMAGLATDGPNELVEPPFMAAWRPRHAEDAALLADIRFRFDRFVGIRRCWAPSEPRAPTFEASSEQLLGLVKLWHWPH